MRATLVEKLRWWMLWSQQNPVCAGVYRKASQYVTRIAGRRLAAVPGVVAVYSRHTHPGSSTFVPGQSDLDLTVMLGDRYADDPECIRQCFRTMERLYRRFLFTKPEDARFMSCGELSRLLRTFDSPFELVCRPENWLLISGHDVRTERSRVFPARSVAAHPEFNRWWYNVIQGQVFATDKGVQNGYMRSIYRSALKNQVHLEAAGGLEVAKPEGFVSDELSSLKFDDSPRLRALLAELRNGGFWTRNPEERKLEIFWEVLNSTAAFFSAQASSSKKKASHAGRVSLDAHARIYEAIREKMHSASDMEGILRSVIAYPLPHALPYIYRVDMVLHDSLPLDEFTEACRWISCFWGGKGCGIANAPVEISLVPAGVFQQPLFFSGTDCPFLLEHIHRFGQTVWGDGDVLPDEERTAGDFLNWCRNYLPFHMITFRRRLEYGSPVLNFCQLASLRIFLETGEKFTDPVETWDHYGSHFVHNQTDRETVEYLLRYPCRSEDFEKYVRALAWVADTYGQLEASLGDRKADLSACSGS